MSSFPATTTLNQVSVEARVIRRDGTVEDLGAVAFWHKNPLRRMAWRLGQIVRGRSPGRVTTRR